MVERARQGLGDLAALFGLVLLTAGPPLALVHFIGWPMPTAVPTVDGIGAGLRTGIDNVVVVKALALLGWLVWSQLALAVAVEVGGLVRWHAPTQAPVLPGIQVTVAKLVAAATPLLGGMAPGRAVAARLAPLARTPVVATVSATATESGPRVAAGRVTESPGATPTAVPAAPPPEGGTGSYVVGRHQSGWGVAERKRGDGRRWQELRSLSAGRAMSDGWTVDATTETLHPGWHLVLPRDAIASAPPPALPAVPSEDPTATEATIRRGGSLWAVAELHLMEVMGRPVSVDEVRSYWAAVVEANRDRLADPDDPSLVFTGQRVRMPPVGGAQPADAAGAADGSSTPAPDPVPAAPGPSAERHDQPRPPVDDAPPDHQAATPSAPAGDAMTTPAPDGREEVADDLGEDDDDPFVATNSYDLGVASTMLAAGTGVALRQHRRRSAQDRPDFEPAAPPADLDDLRAEVIVSGDEDRAERLAAALGHLADSLADRAGVVRPRLVQASAAGIEVLLSERTVPAAAGWRPEASGAVWVCDAGTDLGPPHVPTPVTPCLVSIGAEEQSGQLYLDLEAERLVTVTGEAEDVEAFTRSMLLELASSPLADLTRSFVVGNLPVPPGELGRVRVAGEWDDVADDVVAWIERSQDLLAAQRWATPFTARASGSPDDLAPLVVVLAGRPEDDRFDAVCRMLANAPAAAAVVVVGDDVEGATRIGLAHGEIAIPSLGLRCRAQAVDAATLDVGGLRAGVAAGPRRAKTASEVCIEPGAAEDGGAVTDEYQDPQVDVLVRVLGDIDVVGGTKPLTGKQTAVTAYIALHQPVTTERAVDALWTTPTASRRKRLANTVSECRAAFGAEHLPPAGDGRYRVGPRLRTDLELFERRVSYAATQDPDAALQTLRGALELVTGPVFTYRDVDRGSYVWVDVENWVSTWELHVTALAEDVSRRYCSAGQVDDAIWAARKGLDASPTHSALTGLLMEAYASRGDVKAAEQVFRSHVAALEALQIDEVNSTLLRLRDGIVGNRDPGTTA